MTLLLRAVPVAIALLARPTAPKLPVPVLTPQTSGTTSLLQAVSVIDGQHIWASGHAATYAWSADGGATWHAATVPGADSLQFRDLHAVSPSVAYLMAAGNGEKSGIWKTTDAGSTWTRQFTNTDPKAFYDCMAFWTPTAGFAFSDAVDAHLPLVETHDGATWAMHGAHLPAVEAGEGAFAASGTCAVTMGTKSAIIATGNGSAAHLLFTHDRWATMRTVATPLVATTGAGATSSAFRDEHHGVAVGGTIGGKATGPRVAITSDAGTTWRVGGDPSFAGAIYGATYTRVGKTWVLVAVGPGGASYSIDDGASWLTLDDGSYWSMGFTKDGTGWLVGPKGRITKVTWQ